MKNFIKSIILSALVLSCSLLGCENEADEQPLTKEEKAMILATSAVEETIGEPLAIYKSDHNIELSFWETDPGAVTVAFTYGIDANESKIGRYNVLLNELAEGKKTYLEVYKEVAGENANNKYLYLLRDAEPRIKMNTEKINEIAKSQTQLEFSELNPFADDEILETRRQMAATCGSPLPDNNRATWFTQNMCNVNSSSNGQNPDLTPIWSNCYVNQTRATHNPNRHHTLVYKFFRAWGMSANTQNNASLRVERYDPSNNPGNGFGLVMNMTIPPGVVGNIQQTNYACYADIQAGGCLVHLAAVVAPSYAQ